MDSVPPLPPEPKPGKRLIPDVKLPMVSGLGSASILGLCFVLTAVVIPWALKLPRWIEYEIVLAVWWFIWMITLSCLLYRGSKVAHDYELKRAGVVWLVHLIAEKAGK